MTLRMTNLVTTVTNVTHAVQGARMQAQADLDIRAVDRLSVDVNRIGLALPSQIVKDSKGTEYLCEIIGTHYNPQTDTLILVWEPKIAVNDLPVDDRDGPDLVMRYAGR